MPETLNQTNASASCDDLAFSPKMVSHASCTISLSAVAGTRSASIGGDTSGDGLRAGLFIQSPAGYPGTATWPSGTYTFRLNVTTGNLSVIWRQSNLAFLSAGVCSAQTLVIQSLSSIAMSAGIYTMSLVDLLGTAVDVNAQIYGIYQFTSPATMAQSFVITLNQGINVPFSASALAALTFGLCTMRCGT